jgi:hypothetical protein
MNSDIGAEQLSHHRRRSGGGGLACAFYLTPVPAISCLVLKTPLLANAESFGMARATKPTRNWVSTLGPFVSQSRFIHGIVSRWGIGGSGNFSGNFDAAFRAPSLLNALSLATPAVGAMRAPASTNANSLFIMSSSVKDSSGSPLWLRTRPLAAERITKANVP